MLRHLLADIGIRVALAFSGVSVTTIRQTGTEFFPSVAIRPRSRYHLPPV